MTEAEQIADHSRIWYDPILLGQFQIMAPTVVQLF